MKRKRIFFILAVFFFLVGVLTTPEAMADRRDKYRDHQYRDRDYKFEWRFILPPPPFIIIKPFPDPWPEPQPYPPPPSRGYYGGHWETRWEWCPYSHRWYQVRVWVDHYPYYDGRHPRRW